MSRPALEVAAEDARLRDAERRLLARELHDVVAHQLSTISLQAMGHVSSGNAEELRRALEKVGRLSDSALTELRVLVRVLRESSPAGAGADHLAELSRRVAPTRAAAGWLRQLADAGFDPVFDLPQDVDRLEFTVQATITRTLDVSCDNILRHAPSPSWCTVTVTLDADEVVVRAANPLADPPQEAADLLGWGLRGLRERVDLIGGRFRAGTATAPTAEPQWLVVVALPRD